MKRWKQVLSVVCACMMVFTLSACVASGGTVNEEYKASVQASASAAIVSAVASAKTEAEESAKAAIASAIAEAALRTTTTESTTSKPAEDIPEGKIGDTVALEGWEITVESVEVKSKVVPKSGFGCYVPDEGNQYVLVYITVKNTGKEMRTFLPSFALSNDLHADIIYQGEYEFSPTMFLGESGDLNNTSVNPLSKASGYIAFEIVDEAAASDELALRLTQGDEEVYISLSE